MKLCQNYCSFTKLLTLQRNCEIKSFFGTNIFNLRCRFSTSTGITSNNLQDSTNVCIKQNMNQHFKTISVEGNIGCGKSTMLEIFGKRLDIEAVPEQVEKWTNWNGVDMLQAMYENPSKHGVEFQNIVIETMIESHLKKTHKKLKLMERSIYSTEKCFIKNSFESEIFTKTQFDSLSEKCRKLREDLNISVDCFIYMRISPETALYRIKERRRKGEENISLELLQKLHLLHEEYVHALNTPVVIIDANKSLNEVVLQFDEILNKV